MFENFTKGNIMSLKGNTYTNSCFFLQIDFLMESTYAVDWNCNNKFIKATWKTVRSIAHLNQKHFKTS